MLPVRDRLTSLVGTRRAPPPPRADGRPGKARSGPRGVRHFPLGPYGRLTTAHALVELNADRGVSGGCPTHRSQLPGRAGRPLAAEPRLSPVRRLRVTAAAALVPFSALLVVFGPGLYALA